MLQHLTVVTTGGTIDKIYFDSKSRYEVGEPQIGEILRTLGERGYRFVSVQDLWNRGAI